MSLLEDSSSNSILRLVTQGSTRPYGLRRDEGVLHSRLLGLCLTRLFLFPSSRCLWKIFLTTTGKSYGKASYGTVEIFFVLVMAFLGIFYFP